MTKDLTNINMIEGMILNQIKQWNKYKVTIQSKMDLVLWFNYIY